MGKVISLVVRYGIATATVFISLLIRLLLVPEGMAEAPFVLFFGAVMASAWYGGLWPGLYATALSAFLVDFFILPPIHEIFSGTLLQNLPFALFAADGALISWLCERLQVAKRRSEEGKERMRVMTVELEKHRQHLEELVQQRTRDLDQANCQLVEEVAREKELAKSLQTASENLVRSNQELEQFAYVASHDLQEPLRMVSGYLQLLDRKYKSRLDADADKFIYFAVDGAKRMQTLINDLLAYARISTRAREFEPTDCNKVLSQVKEDLVVAIEESQAVITNDSLPTLMADRTQLSQLFQNLIANAIKFRGSRRPEIHITACPTDSRAKGWKFAVQDNGMGIEDQYFERIFEVFERLHDRHCYPGTGIGLAICRKIVERHGGMMWVKSQVDVGSTFFFHPYGRISDVRCFWTTN